jgi:serine O-acetyltransferase
MRLWDSIKEDWDANGRDWTRPGFRALVVYRFGAWRMGIRHSWLRKPLSFIYWRLFKYVRNVYGIELPYTATLGRRLIIEHQSGIVIHGAARIGDDCIVRQNVTIGNRYLDLPDTCPCIGDRVNIGAGAALLGAITIGSDTNVGANAVVLADVPPFSTVGGNPATIKPRKPKLVVAAERSNG